MRRLRRYVRQGAVVGLLGALLLGSCAGGPAVTSSQLKGSVRSPLAGGVTYYLPKRVVRLDIWETTTYEVKRNEAGADEVVSEHSRRFATFDEILTIPDRNYLMRLTHNTNASYSDTVDVVVSPAGLLQLVKTTIRDEGPAIVAKLAELATWAAKIPTATQKSAGRNVRVVTRLLGRVIVDPTNAEECRQKLPEPITLTAEPLLADACCALEPSPPCEPVCGESGVCYRPVIPYRVTIKPGGTLIKLRGGNFEGAEAELGVEEIMMLPNRSPVVCMPIDRVPFVQSTFIAQFQDGLLTSMTTNRPSQILGFLEIPISVAKAIVSIPGELLNFKVSHYGDMSAAAKGEREAYEAMKELSKVKQGTPEDE